MPGSTDRDRDYWRDVGTLDSYHDAHLDLVSTVPIFNLYNTDWPIFTSNSQLPGAKFGQGASVARLDRLRRLDRVGRISVEDLGHRHPGFVGDGAYVQRSVLLDGVRIGGAPSSATRSSTRTSSSPTVP